MRARLWLGVLVCGMSCAQPSSPEVCEGAASSPLTAPGRYVLGEAVPFAVDPTIRARSDALQTSQTQRRAVGWDIARRTLTPVDVTGLAEGREVPLFQTWYDREDLRRVILHINELRGPDIGGPFTEAELSDAFSWNTTSVTEQEAWPADRLADYIAAMDSIERVQGAGGIERVIYSPRAARHLLASHLDYAQCLSEGLPGPYETSPESPVEPVTETVEITTCGARTLGPYRVGPGGSLRAQAMGDVQLTMLGAPDGRCRGALCEADGPAYVELLVEPRTTAPITVTVTYDTREAPFVPCLGGGFPVGSVIIKADYRRVGFGVLLPVFDTDAETLTRLRSGDADWGEGAGPADPGPDEIFTIELPNGNRFRLAALHVMTKELDHWAWATMWWSEDPDLDFGADRPPALDGSPWENYKMCAATWFSERDPDPTGGATDRTLAQALASVHEGVGGPSWCSNPYLELGPGNGSTNCIGCHQHAGAGLTPEEILARHDYGRDLERLNFPSDYTFAAGDLADLFR